MCAYIFKIMHDKRFGALSYLKICNGSIKKKQRVVSLETGNSEQIKGVYRVFADELKEIEVPVEKNDIIAVSGLTNSKTGDILVDQGFEGKLDTNEYDCEQPFRLLNQQIILPRIKRMEPVYFCSIESRSASQQLQLENALARLSREDPSFFHQIDRHGITTIRGMGKLHLEVIRDRIESEYKVQPLLGPLQISYRETIEGSATEELTVSKMINGVSNKLEIKLYIRSKPKAGSWSSKMLRLDTSGENQLNRLRNDHRKAIESGISSAMTHGPSLGYPMMDCDILLLDFSANARCGLPVIASAASECLANGLRRCSPVLLEPMMLLEVSSPKEFNGAILSDLSTRRASILSTTAESDGSVIIRSRAPLSSLADYSEALRTQTSGRASFSMELHSYITMNESDKRNVNRS